MISLVEREEQQDRVLALCEKTPFGCKIASVISAYGFDKGFACFWLDEEAKVVFCLTDNVMILSGTVQDPEETREFLRMVGPASITCAVRNAEALGLPITESGDVLSKKLEPGEPMLRQSVEVPIREIYGLLEEAGMVEEFEPFYLDLSHKLRHGASHAFWEEREHEMTGCAVVSSVSRSGAILSALAVREPFQRQGVGTKLVKRVEGAFPDRTIYVFREKDQNREFYKALGYHKTDTWVVSQR